MLLSPGIESTTPFEKVGIDRDEPLDMPELVRWNRVLSCDTPWPCGFGLATFPKYLPLILGSSVSMLPLCV